MPNRLNAESSQRRGVPKTSRSRRVVSRRIDHAEKSRTDSYSPEFAGENLIVLTLTFNAEISNLSASSHLLGEKSPKNKKTMKAYFRIRAWNISY